VNVYISTVGYAAGFDFLLPNPDSRLSILEETQQGRNNAVRAFGRNAHSLAVYDALLKWKTLLDNQQLWSFGRFDFQGFIKFFVIVLELFEIHHCLQYSTCSFFGGTVHLWVFLGLLDKPRLGTTDHHTFVAHIVQGQVIECITRYQYFFR